MLLSHGLASYPPVTAGGKSAAIQGKDLASDGAYSLGVRMAGPVSGGFGAAGLSFILVKKSKNNVFCR